MQRGRLFQTNVNVFCCRSTVSCFRGGLFGREDGDSDEGDSEDRPLCDALHSFPFLYVYTRYPPNHFTPDAVFFAYKNAYCEYTTIPHIVLPQSVGHADISST